MKIKTITNKKKKYFLYTIGLGVLLLSMFGINTSLAKYKTTQSINIVKGKINYSLADLNLMAVYVAGDNGYEQQDTIPKSGYILNSEESYCKVSNIRDETITITYNTGDLTFSNLKKGTKCYLYFDIYIPTAKDIILKNITTITTRPDFSRTYTSATAKTLFTAEDNDGTSYYYAGSPTDNWVKFAGYYWRIIRINGDETVRLIYNGTSTSTTGTGTQIGKSSFNLDYNNYAHVGYMYKLENLRGNETSSTIKGVLENWYKNNLTGYTNYIDENAGFCGDRTPSTEQNTINGLVGNYSTSTYYGDHIRYYSSGIPTLKCENSNDLYTITNSSKGNKALTYSIGLINMNEVWLVGGYQENNISYYLYTGQNYWTISPQYFDPNYGAGYSYSFAFQVNSNGYLNGYETVYTELGVRPVINIRADVTLTGTGTTTDPYIVVGAE